MNGRFGPFFQTIFPFLMTTAIFKQMWGKFKNNENMFYFKF